ncbi:hypothetical protein D049_1285 [Vibrio parahaemolyticus VPTS-2010]|nr:hypothetical protein D049_1285 [Vibrio parahaemolyticus VPTS-2010]
MNSDRQNHDTTITIKIRRDDWEIQRQFVTVTRMVNWAFERKVVTAIWINN